MSSFEAADTSSSFSVLSLVASVTVIWYLFIWVLSIIGCLTGRKHFRLRPRSPLSSATETSVPGVSILRPLKGLDTNLFENLESTFTQEYPHSRFEVLLSVADSDDQALSVVRSLLEKYPEVDARVIIGEEVVGVNPKVNNLMRSYREAKHDILWVLDSNIQVASGTLARSVDELTQPLKPGKRRIGLVHHVPLAFASEQMLGSRIEEACLNTNHAKMYLAINRVAVDSCVIGKSCMYRRSDLERVTGDLKPIQSSESNSTDDGKPRGLAAFGRFVAEDNMIGAALWHELGLRHALGCDVAHNCVGRMTLRAYIARRLRWIRVRKHMVTVATLLEPFTECVMVSLLAAWAAHRLWGVPWAVVLIIHYCAWIALDLDVYDSLAGYYLPVEKRWSFLVAWAIRELLAFPIWIIGMAGNEIEWRGRHYRILRNGESERVTPGQGWLFSVFGRRQKKGYEPVDQEAGSFGDQA
ncbi:hypothetical protein ACEPAG_465 [Sanghuangporus baumii]